MEAEKPVESKPQVTWTPNVSTASTGLGGALAVIIISVLHQSLHWEVSPELAVSIGVVCATLAGYLPASGRNPPPN